MKSINNVLKLVYSGVGIVGGITGLINYNGDYGIVGISALLIIISFALISSVYSIIKRRSTTVIGDIAIPRYIIKKAKKEDLLEISNLQKLVYPDDAVPYNRVVAMLTNS